VSFLPPASYDPDFRREDLAEGVTLYLGDCRDVLPTLGQIETIVTDPPYGMNFRSNYRIERHDCIVNDTSDSLLRWICEQPAHHSKYIFCRWDNLSAVPKPRSVINWVKNNWSMGDLKHEHARQTEMILFYAGESHSFPSGRPTDVVDARRTLNNNHPSEKPVDLMRTIVGWTAGTVVDPFMGSGTTGVAAVMEGRRFIGIEMDPAHFETAYNRISEALDTPGLFVPPPAVPVWQQGIML
jgi:site-specific DNA-methyltransferase (adenine-specific)